MIYRILWKQWREQWLPAGLLVAFGIVFVLVTRLAESADTPTVVFDLTLIAATGGAICGVLSLADVQKEQARAFLDRLAPSRLSLWLVRIVAGAAIMLGQGLLLAVGGSCVWTEEVPWSGDIPLYGLVGFGWGAFAAVLTRSEVAALLIGGALALGSELVGQAVPRKSFLDGPGAAEVIVELIVATGTILASGLVYCGVDLQRTLQVSWPPAFLRGPRVAAEQRWLWLIWRRCWLVGGLLVAGFVLGVQRPLHGLLFWPVVTLVGGLVIGWSLLETSRGWEFLLEQRLTRERSWIPGTLPRLVMAASFCGLILAGAWTQKEKLDESSPSGKRSFVERALQVTEEWIVGSEARGGLPGNAAVFLTLWVLTGFSVARLGALCLKNRWLAIAICLPASLVLVGVWVPSLLNQGLAWWQALAPCGILLLGCLMLDWGHRILTQRRKVLVAGACLSMALVCMGGILWYRATEIPDVGEPFAVAAVADTASPEQVRGGQMLVRAAREYRLELIAVTRRLGRPEALPLYLPWYSEERAKQLKDSDSFLDWLKLYHIQLEQVTANGWPDHTTKLERWIEEMGEGDWARLVEAFDGVDSNPRREGEIGAWSSSLDDFTYEINGQTIRGSCRDEAHQMTQLLHARALLLQARGRLRPALDCYRLILKLSRHLDRRGTQLEWLVGGAIEQVACRGLEGWASVVREEKLLLRLLRELQGQEASSSLLNLVRADYLSCAQRPPSDFDVLYEANPGKPAWKRALYHLARLAPWERERARRYLNQAYKDLAEDAGRPSWEVLPRRERKGSRHPLERAVLHLDLYRRVQCQRLCRLRALRLQLALAAYRLCNGRPAVRINDLTPGLLEKVPLDPWSGKPFGYRVSKGERIRIYFPNWYELLAVMDAFRWLPNGTVPPWMAVFPTVWAIYGTPLLGSLPNGSGGMFGGGIHPGTIMQAFEPHRWVAPDRGVLWSVGEDRRDDGGTDEHTDSIFLVPHPATRYPF